MKKLEPLMPQEPKKLWDMGTTYDVVSHAWVKLNETRMAVNDAMDVIESDIMSNDYAAMKALEAAGEAKEAAETAKEAADKVNGSNGLDAISKQIVSLDERCADNEEDIEELKAAVEAISGDDSGDGGVSEQIAGAKEEVKIWVENKNYLTENDLSGKQDVLRSGVNIKSINGHSLLGSGNLIIDGGEGGGMGYMPPDGGIPKSDLAEDVRISLGKADSALQSNAIEDMETMTHAAETYQPRGEYLTSQDIAGKQDAITEDNKIDASMIANLPAVITSYNDLEDKPSIPTVTDTYSADSSEAMSGKAVASAISAAIESLNANNTEY